MSTDEVLFDDGMALLFSVTDAAEFIEDDNILSLLETLGTDSLSDTALVVLSDRLLSIGADVLMLLSRGTTRFPSLVPVATLTAKLAALIATISETIADGVRKGGVRYFLTIINPNHYFLILFVY